MELGFKCKPAFLSLLHTILLRSGSKGAIVFKERGFLKGHIEKDEVTESYHFRDTLLDLLPRIDFPLKIHSSLEHF